jgi:hypothetical protein
MSFIIVAGFALLLALLAGIILGDIDVSGRQRTRPGFPPFDVP